MGIILKRPQAKDDLLEIVQFIAQDNQDKAREFIRIAETSLTKLSNAPELGKNLPFLSKKELKGIFRYILPKPFHNYLVFYQKIDGGIEIVRVLHGARNLEKFFN